MSDKPPLREVLSYYGVELHGSRREVQICCPIHEESRPSCSVNEEEGLIHCLACGFGGDSWSIIIEKEKLDGFRAAQLWAKENLEWSGEGVQRPARNGRGGSGLSRGKGAGFKPAYRNSPLRGRPLSSS